MIRSASIDIGLHNLATVIEDYDTDILSKISVIKSAEKYNNNGEPTDVFHNFLEQVYKEGKIIYAEKKDIIEIKKKSADDEVLIKLSEYLASLNILSTCDIFVIEKQMTTKLIRNNIAKRIQDHIHSYLIEKFGNTVDIVIFNSSNKTKVLGAPKYIENKKMTKYQRKKWAETKADEILKLREDYINHSLFFTEQSKSDDLSDALIMLQSYKYKTYCEKNYVKTKWNTESVNEYITNRNGEWLDDKFINTRQMLNIRCDKGHEFQYTLKKIYTHWCGECYRTSRKLTVDIINERIHKYGGILLSTEIKNSKTLLEFKCKNNHIFWKTADDVLGHFGNWCKECSYKSVGEEICRYHFECLFSKPFKTDKPNWLKNDRNNLMEIDGYNQELKIGFEYSGQQHYEFVKYFHKTLERFQQRIEDDKMKYEICKREGVFLIEIPYTIPFSKLKNYIINIIDTKSECSHIKEIIQRNICINYNNIIILSKNDIALQEVKEMVSILGGECLSKYYINDRTPMVFLCEHKKIFEICSDRIKKKLKKQCWCKCNITQMRQFKKDNPILLESILPDINESILPDINDSILPDINECCYIVHKNKSNAKLCLARITTKSNSKKYCSRHSKYDNQLIVLKLT